MPHSLLLVPLFHPSPLNMTIFSDGWMAFLQPVEIWFPMLSWQLTLNCFSAIFPSGAVRILQGTHTSARRRRSQGSLHYAPLVFGAIQRVERVSLPLVPRAFCPQPRQTIRILRQQRKLQLIHSRMCSSNQYPAHPVKKKVFRAPLVRLLHLRTGLYV